MSLRNPGQINAKEGLADGDSDHFSGMSRDIASPELSQEDLTELQNARAWNRRFRALMDGVSDYALFTMDQSGRVTSWNSGAERMLGYRESDVTGQEFSRMFMREDIENKVPQSQLLKTSRDGHTEHEGWRVRGNGSQFWAKVKITALAPERGQAPEGFAVVMQDITERRKAAAELDTVRQERMNLQDQFLSHVSHELRTPLTAVHYFVTNLLEGVDGELNPAQRETLRFSLENIKQLRDMVSDLLDVSRVQTLKLSVDLQPTYMPAVVAEVLRTCRANAKSKNIRLLADLTPSLPAAWADRARLRQVLINLIDNAIRFTPDGGTVAVKGSIFAEDESFLCLSVVDTGCGISAENQATIFDRLAQVKALTESSRKGLGLGLFISKELVTRQGGRIWVKSEENHGSTFSFTLPIFSLAKACSPILSPANLAAGCVVLLAIDLPMSQETTALWNSGALRRALERCIIAGQDLLLPAMTDEETPQTLFVVACAQASGGEAISKRFQRELVSFFDKAELKPVISVTAVQLPADDRPWEERKREATARIEKMIQAHNLERKRV
jgi:PAS domain S-box-containing protein